MTKDGTALTKANFPRNMTGLTCLRSDIRPSAIDLSFLNLGYSLYLGSAAQPDLLVKLSRGETGPIYMVSKGSLNDEDRAAIEAMGVAPAS